MTCPYSINRYLRGMIRLFILYICLLGLTLPALGQRTAADYVNPFIGTDGNGHTFPGACTPFGMVQPSPVTGAWGWRYCAEYQFADSVAWGFSQTHLNGTGCMDLGNVLLMPSQTCDGRPCLRSRMDKTTERAEPGYYTVRLEQASVRAELTSTPHVAYHRYLFDRPDSALLVVDLQHGPAWSEAQYHTQVRQCDVAQPDDCTLEGHVESSVWVRQDVYFCLRLNCPVAQTDTLPAQPGEVGRRLVLHLPPTNGRPVEVKVALSAVSVEGARRNLEAELPHWDFETTRRQAKQRWNELLQRFELEGSEAQQTAFYTALYHACIQPNNVADADGTYRTANGVTGRAEGGTFYSTFSCWDTYRAAHPLYTLCVPEQVAHFVRSLVAQAEAQGHLPVWSLWGKDNYCMIANHAVSIVAEAVCKGFDGIDRERAWRAVEQTLRASHPAKTNWEICLAYGYYPADLVKHESVSMTLEQAYDDYAASRMARALGKQREAREFAQRARCWRKLLCPTTRFMRPRLSDGSWKKPLDPAALSHAEGSGGDYTEGNAWQYTWHVQHEPLELMRLMGGKRAFCRKLDSLFTTQPQGAKLADVTGLIGQYAHGNEPSHHVAYLYALAGQPERTQELVNTICDTQYAARPDGLCGNDDCGQMSAWYVLSCMGFYPVDPVSGHYVLGAPQLPHIRLQLPHQRAFTIVAEGLDPVHRRVQAVYLNGKRLRRNFLTHQEIAAGGELRFVMKRCD